MPLMRAPGRHTERINIVRGSSGTDVSRKLVMKDRLISFCVSWMRFQLLCVLGNILVAYSTQREKACDDYSDTSEVLGIDRFDPQNIINL